jgi:hypothetical protein
MAQRSSIALALAAVTVTGLGAACTEQDPDGQPNPFTADLADDGKEDSAYLNPDGFEVEVDLEGDVTGPAYRLEDGPAALGQFALTNLRKNEVMYLESLAEDAAGADRAEWLINGAWVANDRVPAGAVRKHWRMRAINAVVLNTPSRDVAVGKVYTASVPMNPFSIMTDARDTCADDDDHIGLDASVYWYRWLPEQASCKIAKQPLKITVSKKFPTLQRSVYPEYDQLTADRKVTAVILFGQIDDGAITESETGMRSFKRYARWLTDARYKEVAAPVGKRFEKTLAGGITAQIDLYSPRDFAGLDDNAHFANFQRALSEHEIVVWDGHSMLGASDFWSRPTYPKTYQIFLYGGCLGYEYYVRPILAGKGGNWAKLDLMSSVVEVSASANEFAGPAIAKILYAVEHGGKSTWRQILLTVRTNVGDSTFGVSGVRDNCYTPTGSRCTM